MKGDDSMLQNRDYFYNSLEVAKQGEKIVSEIFQNKGYTVVDVSNEKKWQEIDVDLLVFKNDKLINTIEVKFDEKALETRNIFIETKSNNGLGWIWKTKADYIYIVIPGVKVYVLYRDEFVAWFKSVMYECKSRSAKTTDRNGKFLYHTWGRLIPLSVIDSLEFAYSIHLN